MSCDLKKRAKETIEAMRPKLFSAGSAISIGLIVAANPMNSRKLAADPGTRVVL